MSEDKKDEIESRRKAIKTTLAGCAVISTSILPDKWEKPALDSVLLPAHATMTNGAEMLNSTSVTRFSPDQEIV